MTRRTRTLAATAGAAALVAIIGGIAAVRGDPTRTAPEPDASPSASVTPPKDVPPAWDGMGPPPATLRLDGADVDLHPWTSCFTQVTSDGERSSACADGLPVPPFEDVGERPRVDFGFPLAGWTFTASFTPAGEGQCKRRITVPVERTGTYSFQIPPAGPTDSYEVDLEGRGPGGDYISTFAWTTTETGRIPRPRGSVGLVSDDGDPYRTYPLEVFLEDMATTPRRASASVTVTAADGSARTFRPTAPKNGCASEGNVFFFGADDPRPRERLDLGPAPLTYRVEITMDGTTYVGAAVWPRDERRDKSPYTNLTFDPPLPAYTG